MEDYHEQIQNWLSEIYGDKKIPQFEINERTLTLLHGLSTRSVKSNNLSLKVIEDLNIKSMELSLERNRIANILNKIGISAPLKGSNSAQQSIKAIVSAALELELVDTSIANFILGISELKMKEIDVSRKLLKETYMSQKLLQKTKDSMQKLSALKYDSEKAAMNATKMVQEANYEARNTNFLRQKSEGYKKAIYSLEKKFSKINPDKAIRHEELVKFSEKNEDLSNRHAATETKIKSYQDFPAVSAFISIALGKLFVFGRICKFQTIWWQVGVELQTLRESHLNGVCSQDIHLAKLKLAEAKIELDKLEEELLEKIKPSSLMER